MSQTRDRAAEDLATLIKKEIRRETNARFLRGMPPFQANEELPEKFKLLLSRLESAEARPRGR
jgi:hypothetical protein